MNRLDELRREFDESFAAPVRTETEATTDFLAIRVASRPFALRLLDLAHVYTRKRIVALPSSVPELLGLAGIRGRVVPVYSLARLLGQSGEGEVPSWLATCDAGGEAAYAFEAFDRHLRVAANRIRPLASSTFMHERISDGRDELEVIELSEMTSSITGRKRE